MERGRPFVTALHDHASTVTHASMAGSAIDVEAILASEQELTQVLFRKLVRQVIAQDVAVFSGEEVCVIVQLTLGHGSGHWIAGGALVREKSVRTQRDELGLVLHVLAAAGKDQCQGEECRKDRQRRANVCRRLNAAPP
jgi:hypothetical protein